MKVAVIGAGPTGLVFLKELVEAGHDASCFEAGEKLGGIFSRAYDGARLTSSSVITAFSDFSDGREAYPVHWDFPEYLDYLERYVDHFGLRNRLHLRCTVETVGPSGDGYFVAVRAPDGRRRELFDRVAVCSGVHITPVRPSWPGEDRFKGEIIHSKDFRSAKDFKGRRVVIVGGGESAADIALEVSKVAKETHFSVRRTFGMMIPRSMGEWQGQENSEARHQVFDLDTARAHHSLPLAIGPFVTKPRNWLMLGTAKTKSLPRFAEELCRINMLDGTSEFNTFGTKTASAARAIVDYGCRRAPEIKELREDRVVFADASEFRCDIIMCTTGFQPRFRFLEEHYPEVAKAATRPRENLYKHCVHPDVGPNLVWGGLVRPAFGAIPPMAELQARYFALLCNGERELPSPSTMREVIERDDAKAKLRYLHGAERVGALTDFLRYQDDLARLIGCLPSGLFSKAPSLWYKVVFGPITGAQYRLRGPGAKPALAKETLARTPVHPSEHIYAPVLLGCHAAGLLPRLSHWKPHPLPQ